MSLSFVNVIFSFYLSLALFLRPPPPPVPLALPYSPMNSHFVYFMFFVKLTVSKFFFLLVHVYFFLFFISLVAGRSENCSINNLNNSNRIPKGVDHEKDKQ